MNVAAVQELLNLVGGELVGAVDGATRDIVNPASGQIIGRVPEGSDADVERAVDAARAARIGWRDTTPGQRMEALLALADAIDRHADELAALESANVGKPQTLAAEELPICSDELRFFAGAARTMEAPAAGGVQPRPHLTGSTRAGRDRRADRAVELPADDGDLEDRTGPGRG